MCPCRYLALSTLNVVLEGSVESNHLWRNSQFWRLSARVCSYVQVVPNLHKLYVLKEHGPSMTKLHMRAERKESPRSALKPWACSGCVRSLQHAQQVQQVYGDGGQ